MCRTTLTIHDIGSNVTEFDPTMQPIHLKVALFIQFVICVSVYPPISSFTIFSSSLHLKGDDDYDRPSILEDGDNNRYSCPPPSLRTVGRWCIDIHIAWSFQ